VRRRAWVQAHVDLARTVGLRHTWRRARARRAHRRLLGDRRASVAESMWRAGAEAIGAETTVLAPGVLELRLGDRVTRVRGEATQFADVVSRAIADDKPLGLRLLAEAGVPVPEHAVVRTGEEPASILARVGAPCVVKPLAGSGGEGVTGAVVTPAQLRRALVYAGRSGPEALVEREVEGDSYRVLVLDGAVLDVLRRARPRVRGDGRSTVEELVFGEYEARLRDEGAGGLKHFVVDLDCLFTLARQGITLESVPADGEEVVVKTASNYGGPAETAALDSPLAGTAVAAARALGVRLAGVDLVAPDETGGVVLEVNPVPGLSHHVNVLEGARPVAAEILRALLA
jgi:cyanophycin synthetase